jgi:hypothetical protein
VRKDGQLFEKNNSGLVHACLVINMRPSNMPRSATIDDFLTNVLILTLFFLFYRPARLQTSSSSARLSRV